MAKLEKLLVALELAYSGKFRIKGSVRTLKPTYLRIWKFLIKLSILALVFVIIEGIVKLSENLTDIINYAKLGI